MPLPVSAPVPVIDVTPKIAVVSLPVKSMPVWLAPTPLIVVWSKVTSALVPKKAIAAVFAKAPSVTLVVPKFTVPVLLPTVIALPPLFDTVTAPNVAEPATF